MDKSWNLSINRMEAELFLRKKFKVPKGKTLTEVQPPFDCWRDVIKLMEEFKYESTTTYNIPAFTEL